MIDNLQTEQQELIPLKVNVSIHYKDNKICIDLRRTTNDLDLIKQIVSCAFHSRPIIILPQFHDSLQSLNNLIDKGVIYKDFNDGQYYFTI